MQVTEKDKQEILQIITEYNNKIEEASKYFNGSCYLLCMIDAGSYFAISIGETNIFTTYVNDRKYNENTDKYEPWRSYIKRKIQELTNYQNAINKLINRK